MGILQAEEMVRQVLKDNRNVTITRQGIASIAGLSVETVKKYLSLLARQRKIYIESAGNRGLFLSLDGPSLPVMDEIPNVDQEEVIEEKPRPKPEKKNSPISPKNRVAHSDLMQQRYRALDSMVASGLITSQTHSEWADMQFEVGELTPEDLKLPPVDPGKLPPDPEQEPSEEDVSTVHREMIYRLFSQNLQSWNFRSQFIREMVRKTDEHRAKLVEGLWDAIPHVRPLNYDAERFAAEEFAAERDPERERRAQALETALVYLVNGAHLIFGSNHIRFGMGLPPIWWDIPSQEIKNLADAYRVANPITLKGFSREYGDEYRTILNAVRQNRPVGEKWKHVRFSSPEMVHTQAFFPLDFQEVTPEEVLALPDVLIEAMFDCSCGYDLMPITFVMDDQSKGIVFGSVMSQMCEWLLSGTTRQTRENVTRWGEGRNSIFLVHGDIREEGGNIFGSHPRAFKSEIEKGTVIVLSKEGQDE